MPCPPYLNCITIETDLNSCSAVFQNKETKSQPVHCSFSELVNFPQRHSSPSGNLVIGNPVIHSFIMVISIAPLQVLYYSEALPTTARILCRSFTLKHTGNCR